MSDSDSDTDYFQDIVSALQSVKRPGFFGAGGVVQLPFPALEIHGIPGKIGLPVSHFQAKEIAEKCSRAPFGRGEDTIVDTSVRCTWQLSPAQFAIGNPAWRTELDSLVGRVKIELGCDATQNVTYDLYKLLLYEPGGFFKPHRDTEKVDGMFGTLVIQLLSDYSGGELVVSHCGKEKVFNFSGMEGCVNFHYAAFYADCQHEIKKVTEGFRLCLIYNLIYRGAGSTPAPADNQAIVGRVVNAVKQWNEDAAECRGPEVMAYLLEHKYCEASLNFRSLKNADRAIGDVLVSAHKEFDFDLYLAHVTVSQSWSAECYHSGYHRWYDDSEPEYDVVDMCDEEVSASHFVAPNGQKLSVTDVMLEEESIVPKESFELVDPDGEHCEEATGNEGATVERMYKWSALILWPPKQRVSVMGLDDMTTKLKADVVDKPALSSEQERKQCLELAQDLVQQSRCTSKLSSKSATELLCCLQALGETDLLRKFLAYDISTYVSDEGFCAKVISLSESLGMEAVKPVLLAMLQKVHSVDACCRLVDKVFTLSNSDTSSLASKYKLLCKEMVTAFVIALSCSKANVISPNSAIALLKCLQSLKEGALISQFLSVIASTSDQVTYYSHAPPLRSPAFIEQLLDVGKNMGWETLRPGLSAFMQSARDKNVCCDLLSKLCALSIADPSKPGFRVLCKHLTAVLIEGLASGCRSLSLDSAVTLLKCIQGHEEVGLLSKFLKAVPSSDVVQFFSTKAFIDQILQVGRVAGWNTLTHGLCAIFQKLTERNVNVCCNFLMKLVPTANLASMTDQQKTLGQTLMKKCVEFVCQERDIATPVATANPIRHSRISASYTPAGQQANPRTEEFVLSLFKLAVCLQIGKGSLTSLMSAFLRQPTRYPIGTVIAPALEKLCVWVGVENSAPLIPLVTCCITALEIQKPAMNVSVRCACEDCRSLQEFLRNNNRTQVRFRMVMKRRAHLEQQLAYLRSHTTYFTERSGSPHTLVVTKTKQALEEVQQQQQTALKAAARLRKLCVHPPLSSSEIAEPLAKRKKKDNSASSSASSTVVDLTHET